MNLREYIKTYTIHGGSWYHLEKYLIQAGMSNELADYYVSRIRAKLGEEHSEKALDVYDFWLNSKSENEVQLYMLLLQL